MARLFGLIAKRSVDCTFSLSKDPQRRVWTHGWGMGWYDKKGKPAVQKGKRSTLEDTVNREITLTVLSPIILTHLRQASSGAVTVENAHPFWYDRFLFAHIGRVHKDDLFPLLQPPFNQAFQSEPIDSEVYFRLILQYMHEKGAVAGLKDAVKKARDPRGSTFILSDGQTLYAYSYGLPLYYIRWKHDTPLTILSPQTGVQIQSQQLAYVPGMLVSSEILTSDNWTIFDNDELLTVYSDLNYKTEKIY